MIRLITDSCRCANWGTLGDGWGDAYHEAHRACRGAGRGAGGARRAEFDEGNAAYQRGEYATALTELRPLAAEGDARAQFSLGLMYVFGQGVAEDFAEATKWFGRAADQGHASAQFNLGVMYAYGRGVPQEYVLAHMWFNLGSAASPAGELRDKAVLAREQLSKLMTAAQISEAQRAAREWTREHP